MAKKENPLDASLAQAVEAGDEQWVRELLSQGANPNTKKKRKSLLDIVSPLQHEIKCDLIEAGARQTSLKRDLVWAISRGRLATVEALIEYGADLNVKTPIGTPLMSAVETGKAELVALLLQKGADVNVSSGFATPFTKAIDKDLPEVVERLLKAGCRVDLTPEYGEQQALEYAVLNRALACARLLLENGANPNFAPRQTHIEGFKKPCSEMSPLHVAAATGKGDFVQLLLDYKADPQRRCGKGKTALDWARESGHQAVSKLLASQTPETEEEDPDELLLSACDKGDKELAQRALAAGAKLECRDARSETKGFTPLLLAAAKNKCELASWLLKRGANVNAVPGGEKIPSYLLSNIDDEDTLVGMGYSLNRTALIWALIHKNADLVLTLMNAGADPELPSHTGETPMVLAAGLNQVEVLEALKAFGVKPDKAGGGKQTPLMTACSVGAKESVRWLLRHKAKTKRKNRDGETPVSLACSGGHIEVLRLLVGSGADLSFQSEWGGPLAAAAGATKVVPYSSGQESFISVSYTDKGATTFAPLAEHIVLEMVRILLEGGADPNDSSGTSTPLGSAAQSGHLEVVKVLIAAGARPKTQDTMGNTALDIAKMFKRQSVVEYLQNLGMKPTPIQADEDEEPLDYKAVYAPIPKLAKKLASKSFRQALQRLEETCGSQAVLLDNHAEVHVDATLQTSLKVADLQDDFSALGYFLVECSGSFSLPQKLALLPSPRWQDALALFQTNGINYDVASQNIIDWFEEWESVNPVRILALRHDVVSGKLLNKVKKPKTYAKSMFELCPDTVEQGLGTLDALVEELKKNGCFYLWWD